MLPNESSLQNFNSLKISDYASSTIILSQSEITIVTNSTFSTRSSEHKEKNDVNNAVDSNNIIIIILSLNTALILIVCCVIGLCVYYKRKVVSNNSSSQGGNKCNKKSIYAKQIFSQDVLLQNIHDFDLKMTNSGENSQRCVTNDIEVPSLVQENHLQRDVHVYENDSDPYLNPENNEVELEYHQYLTVV